MSDPAAAITQAEEALSKWRGRFRPEPRIGTTLDAADMLASALRALLPVARAAVERAEKAEAALAEEREKRERAEKEMDRSDEVAADLRARLDAALKAARARADLLARADAAPEPGTSFLATAQPVTASAQPAPGMDWSGTTGTRNAALGVQPEFTTAQPTPLEEAVKEALWRFGAVMFREFWDDGNPGDIDGGAAQEAAEEHGLWHQVERHADGVECEWCGNEGPCGELTEVGLAALAGEVPCG